MSSSAPATSAVVPTGRPRKKKTSIPAVTTRLFAMSRRSTRTRAGSTSTRPSSRNSFQNAAAITATVRTSPTAAVGTSAAANWP